MRDLLPSDRHFREGALEANLLAPIVFKMKSALLRVTYKVTIPSFSGVFSLTTLSLLRQLRTACNSVHAMVFLFPGPLLMLCPLTGTPSLPLFQQRSIFCLIPCLLKLSNVREPPRSCVIALPKRPIIY